MSDNPAEQHPGSDLTPALQAWANVLGDRHVLVGEAAAPYGRSTAPTAATPSAVLLPESVEQVREVLRIASRYKAPVHPISRGKNWGYGDAAPPRDGQVVLDLQRMNRILEVNAPLAYAVIEPGVTQGQLHRHLVENRIPLWMDATGAGLDASILGNTLDRGFGHTPHGDHLLNTAGMQFVLADGTLLETGLGHFGNAHATPTYRYGVGPSLDGIFSQSNLAVLTRASVWLNPVPEAFAAFFASTSDERDLPRLMDQLARLRLDGVVRSPVHLGNDLRAMSSRMLYPYDRTGGAKHMPDAVRSALAREMDIGAWNVSGGLYGSAAMVRAAQREVRRALRGFRLVFLTPAKLRAARAALNVAAPLGVGRKQARLLDIVEPLMGLLQGVPSDEFRRGVLWQAPPDRLRANPSLDPLDHHVGLMWISPILPSQGRHAEHVMRILDPIFREHGFDLPMTFTLITERSSCGVANITFDRDSADECRRATACYDQAFAAILAAGYPPYRTGAAGYAKLRASGSAFWSAAQRLKDALDPNNIISPGRYLR